MVSAVERVVVRHLGVVRSKELVCRLELREGCRTNNERRGDI